MWWAHLSSTRGCENRKGGRLLRMFLKKSSQSHHLTKPGSSQVESCSLAVVPNAEVDGPKLRSSDELR